MHPQVALIVAQQQIADLHRAADHNRRAHNATTTATSSHGVGGPSHAAPAPVSVRRWLRRRLA